jgi:acetyl esterase/lipase
MLKFYTLLICVITSINTLSAQDALPLYPDKVPNSKEAANEEKTEERDGITIVSKISKPTLRFFPAPAQDQPAATVIIFPGGGYSINALSHEGHDVARKFNEIGISAFVVKYRIPNDRTMLNKEIGPLQDAQQAIKVVREQAAKFKVNPERIGIMGFSAGGHLASTAGTHFNEIHIPNEKNTSLRPDFMILVYPVISFQDDIGHRGSRNNLLGNNPDKPKIDHYSNELQITKQTPPSFLIHAGDDKTVEVANSIKFYENLVKHDVPAELHIYQAGGHGFGLNNPTTKDDWFLTCKHWLDANGWLTVKKK